MASYAPFASSCFSPFPLVPSRSAGSHRAEKFYPVGKLNRMNVAERADIPQPMLLISEIHEYLAFIGIRFGWSGSFEKFENNLGALLKPPRLNPRFTSIGSQHCFDFKPSDSTSITRLYLGERSSLSALEKYREFT